MHIVIWPRLHMSQDLLSLLIKRSNHDYIIWEIILFYNSLVSLTTNEEEDSNLDFSRKENQSMPLNYKAHNT